MLGLPDTISACLLDLDGVLTKTATVHAHASKQMYDDVLEALGEPPFELPGEYDRYVDGKQRYEGSVRYAEAARDAGLRRAVVSSSANAGEVLAAARIEHLVETVIDGVAADRGTLHGKRAPDMFLAGARALGTPASNAAVFEDALAGVEAGRNGSFGFVVGVDRSGQAQALSSHGADIVVADLAELLERPA